MTALLIEAIQARVDSLADTAGATGHLLRGIAGVTVLDLKVSSLMAAQGITDAGLRRRLARELSAAGIPMPTPQDGRPLGGVVGSVDGLQAGDGTWAVCVLLELKQRARLSRDPGTAFDATTWSGKLPAITRTGELEGTCGQLIRQLAQELAAVLQETRRGAKEAG